jgi:predicted RNase H-like nuclease (RuvC/YqgF family)
VKTVIYNLLQLIYSQDGGSSVGRIQELEDNVSTLKRALLERDREIEELRQSNNNLQRIMSASVLSEVSSQQIGR